jgi:hypothetical protein
LTLFFANSSAKGQLSDQMIRQHVLRQGIIDSLFIFGKWTEKGKTETHLKYLGSVKTRKGQTYKVLNSIWFWGLAHRATSRILIFNNDNQYVGNYYVTLTSDLPTEMTDGKLVFKNGEGDCDKKLVTFINLKNGLPKQFFRKCKDKYGDIYNLDFD